MPKAQKGIYAAAITPKTPDGRVDLPKLAQYCGDLIAAGLTGVAPAGTTGEGNSLPFGDRLALPGALADAGVAHDRVILGTGACAVGDAIDITKASCAAEYRSVLVLPPFYYKGANVDGLYGYYADLIDGVGDANLRVYLYHFPQMSAVPIPLALIERLKADFGASVAGLKDSSGDYEGTLKFVAAAEDFDVFPSTEAMLLQGQSDGCAGVISATVNAHPGLAGATLLGRAATDQAALADLRGIIAAYPLSAALKQIQTWKSGDDTWRAPFAPLTPLTGEQADALWSDLDQFGRTYPDHRLFYSTKPFP